MTTRKRSSARSARNLEANIRVRMYNVGFGDCFLLHLPTPSGLKKVAIDCGSLKQKEHPIRVISDRLIADVTDSDGVPRIDVLIMSHRHADHISGFTNPNWSQVEVGEIWMPWIESREDPKARALQRRQRAAAEALLDSATKLGLDPLLADVALNARSNDDSLDVLHGGFAKKVRPRFFPSGNSTLERIHSDLLAGVEVFVLGPPHDLAALKDPDPPRGQILLTGYVDDLTKGEIQKFRPFSADWIDEDRSLPDFNPFEIDEAASKTEMYELAAAELDAEINNTSLVIVFRVGDHYLLFPGDAQWGPWEKILTNEDSVDLLKKVTFLKVSHHASHNGTPATLLKDVIGKQNRRNGKVVAMISVTPYSKWKNIPHEPIITAMIQSQFPFAVTDMLQDQVGFKRDNSFWLEVTLT
jgi:beta-lactamase superfamily II metal-dependent hydrolase